MRPTPIPDHEIWEGATRKVIGPPGGDLNAGVAPVEALVDHDPAGHLCLSSRCMLEPGDLEKLQAGGNVWVTFWGGMVPWAASVVGPDEHQRPDPAARLEQRTGDTEDCPDASHLHRWYRPELVVGTDVEYFADARGQVQITEEALSRLLRAAGFRTTVMTNTDGPEEAS